MRPRVSPRCVESALNLTRSMFHLRDQRLRLAHVLLMTIEWTPSPPPRHTSSDVLSSNACDAGTFPAKKKLRRNIVPYRENVWNNRVYKLGQNNALALLPQLSN